MHTGSLQRQALKDAANDKAMSLLTPRRAVNGSAMGFEAFVESFEDLATRLSRR